MIPKQDRSPIRQAREIEQKYDLNKDYSKVENIALNAHKAAEKASGSVDHLNSEVMKLDERIDQIEDAGGVAGEDGATFTPSVDKSGNLSWTNDKGLENPETVNIKGKDGEDGVSGVYIGSDAPNDDSVTVWLNPDGEYHFQEGVEILSIEEIITICS